MAKRVVTSSAQALYDGLIKEGIQASLECWDEHKHIDICISSAKLYIEVDGMQHFTNPDQMARDFIRDHYSDDNGFNTLRIPNQIVKDRLGEVIHAIKKVVAERQINLEHSLK